MTGFANDDVPALSDQSVEQRPAAAGGDRNDAVALEPPKQDEIEEWQQVSDLLDDNQAGEWTRSLLCVWSRDDWLDAYYLGFYNLSLMWKWQTRASNLSVELFGYDLLEVYYLYIVQKCVGLCDVGVMVVVSLVRLCFRLLSVTDEVTDLVSGQW